MDLNKAVEHCWDRRDYPEIISDDAGLDISIPRFYHQRPMAKNITVLEGLP